MLEEPLTYRGKNRIVGVITFKKYDYGLTDSMYDTGLIPEYDYQYYEELGEDHPDYLDEDEFRESEEYEEGEIAALARVLHLPPGKTVNLEDYGVDWRENPEPVFMSTRFDRGMDNSTVGDLKEAYQEFNEEAVIEID